MNIRKIFVIVSLLLVACLLFPQKVYAIESMYWLTGEDGKQYWYEDDIKQGTYDDPKAVIGDGTVRGREIYDPESDAWYWLDSVYDGAKAVNKEVWLPYVFQNEDELDETEINQLSGFGRYSYILDSINNKEGKWVRYDENGSMMKGWVRIGGADERSKYLAELYPDQAGNRYYYDHKTGQMVKGWATISYSGGESRYYFDPVTGAVITGFSMIDDARYVFDGDGCLIERAYFDEITGLLKIDESDDSGFNEKIIECGADGNINWWVIQKFDPRSSLPKGVLVISGICDETDGGFENAGFHTDSLNSYIEDVIIDVRNATDLSDLFCGMYMLKTIEGLENLNTGKVTDMSGMFAGCTNLTNLDLSNFDTSNVTDMSEMFKDHGFMTELDLSMFDTGNVTDMHGMFASNPAVRISGGSVAPLIWKVDLSSFDTSKVTDMSKMFYTSFMEEIDIRSFDTSNVEDMTDMFSYANDPVLSDNSLGVVKSIVVGNGWVIGESTKADNVFAQCGVDYVTKTD